MNLFSITASVNAPSSLWVTLINWIKASVGNLGWTIILVTVLVKLITTPLDFVVKLSTKKQTLAQQRYAPQVAKLQKKFGNDRQALQAQTQALYKREGINMGAGCLIMIINLILSCTIFFTFYDALKKVSAYEAINQYTDLKTTYETTMNNLFVDADSNNEIDEYVISNDENSELGKFVNKYTQSKFVYEQKQTGATEIKLDLDNNAETPETVLSNTEIDEFVAFYNKYNQLVDDVIIKTKDSVSSRWEELKKDSSWLWIQNIWVADSSTPPFPNFATLQSLANSTGYGDYLNYEKVKDNTILEQDYISEEDYNKVATIIIENSERQTNGYYILAILAAVITFASQYISDLHNKLKNKKANKIAKASGQNATSMTVMKFIMPIIMVLFVLTATASFGLYILASNIASIVFGEIATIFVDIITRRQRLAVESELEKEADRLIKKGKLEG